MPYKDPAKQREAVRRYYQNHKEKCQQISHDWYLKNKEYCAEQAKNYYDSNKGKIIGRRLNNYHSVRYRKGERHLIENYELACTTETLKRLDMYYNRPYFELIYMRTNEHTTLHNKARWKAGAKIGRQRNSVFIK